MTPEVVRAKPWKGVGLPKKILVIRLTAFGDTIVTLPWLLSLRQQVPDAQIDFLTLSKNADIPENIILFDHVRCLSGTTAKKQFAFAMAMLPSLILSRYDVVIDLQRNRISRWVRRLLFPKAWSEIERFSKILAGEKFRAGIEAAGFAGIQLETSFRLRDDPADSLLRKAGWNGADPLILLNPAGAFATRNWPLANYSAFASAWLKEVHPTSKFLFLGLDRITEKTAVITASIGIDKTINLVNSLTPAQAFSVLSKVSLVVTEDSGLMHMAWVQGIPTVALFGGSPAYSAPMGSWSLFLDSTDLPCGNCNSELCRMHDLRCLTRHTPESVMRIGVNLLASLGK